MCGDRLPFVTALFTMNPTAARRLKGMEGMEGLHGLMHTAARRSWPGD